MSSSSSEQRNWSDDAAEDESSSLWVPRPEELLIGACDTLRAARIVCTSLGRAQLAAQLARSMPEADVRCHFLDLYPAEEAQSETSGPENLAIECTADLPPGEFDLAVIPVSRFGEAELTRDILQSACDRLIDGGRLVAAVDNAADKWLHSEMHKLFSKVTREPQRRGVIYRGTRRGSIKRPRDFRCEFAFRDGERLVKLLTRPGVFSHRQLDLGARALLEAMTVRAGDRLLDIGCGSGAVGLAAALRAEHVHVTALDSNARAVECTRAGAALNGLSIVDTFPPLPATDPPLQSAPPAGRGAGGEGHSSMNENATQPTSTVTVLHNAHGRVPDPGAYDLAIGNPPYYSHYQIAEIFVQAARRALKPGGRVLLVTKKDDWHLARLGQLFDGVESREVRGYRVVSAVQRGESH